MDRGTPPPRRQGQRAVNAEQLPNDLTEVLACAAEPLSTTQARAAATLPDQGAADNARARAARRWGPGWHSALAYLADEPLLSNALSRTLELDPRQGHSLVMTIREALSPWTQCVDERE